MNSSFPKDFLWGGATADFQYEGGFNEGGRGINSQDFVTSGSVKQKRQITLQLQDGSRGTVNSLESFPVLSLIKDNKGLYSKKDYLQLLKDNLVKSGI